MSNETQILLPSNFSADKVTLSEPKGPENKAKTVYVNYAKEKFIFQTPEMPLPFGLSKWDNEGKGPTKYSVDLSFKEKDSRNGVNKFFQMISTLDEMAIEAAIKNKAAWFKGKKYTDEMIPTLYTPSIKYAKDKKTKEITYDYPATFKTVLPYNDQEKTISTRIYDGKKNLIDIMTCDNTKGARAALIVQCAGIWISTTGFGISWKAAQMRIVPPTTIKEYAFTSTEDDNLAEESDDLEEGATAASKEDGQAEAVEEDNEEGEPARPPPVRPEPKAAAAKKQPPPRRSPADHDMLDDDDDDDIQPPAN
jgi:hypothetical protein